MDELNTVPLYLRDWRDTAGRVVKRERLDHQLSVLLPKFLRRRVDAVHRSEGISRAECVRRLISHAVPATLKERNARASGASSQAAQRPAAPRRKRAVAVA